MCSCRKIATTPRRRRCFRRSLPESQATRRRCKTWQCCAGERGRRPDRRPGPIVARHPLPCPGSDEELLRWSEVKRNLRRASWLANACPGLSWHEGEMLCPLVWGGGLEETKVGDISGRCPACAMRPPWRRSGRTALLSRLARQDGSGEPSYLRNFRAGLIPIGVLDQDGIEQPGVGSVVRDDQGRTHLAPLPGWEREVYQHDVRPLYISEETAVHARTSSITFPRTPVRRWSAPW